MVIGYIRIRCSIDDAISRYGRWIAAPEVAPRRLVPERKMIELSLDGEEWLGLSVFIYTAGEWAIIEEVSGGLALRPAESWLDLAQGGDLVYASCNDALPYALLVVIENGRLVRHYMQDEQDPTSDVDIGRLPEEAKSPFESWISAMGWIEEEELGRERPDQGWLWIHRAPR